MDAFNVPIELRITGQPIIQVYSDKVDITKNLNVEGDITFTGSLYDSNGVFTGGTTYDDVNRLDYEFLSEPISEEEVTTNYAEPISTPSITPTTITGTDFKYMTFLNTNTFPILSTDNNNLLIHYKFDTIPTSGGKLTNYGNLGSSYDADINLNSSGIERVAGDRGQFKYFWKSDVAPNNFLSIPNNIIKLLDTNGHSLSFWTQDNSITDSDYTILSGPTTNDNNQYLLEYIHLGAIIGYILIMEMV